jgi:predicted TIM-barrel fold metal-dependent hydrolase
MPVIASPGQASRSPKTTFDLVDTDVHCYARNGLRDVLPYMSVAWQKRFEIKGLDLNEDALSYRFANPHEGGALRKDARPPGGGSSGSDPAFLVEHHLNRFGIDCAILNNLQILSLAAVQAQPDESIVLCSAFNDFFLEHWLPFDDRFRYAATVPVQDPLKAAAEIRRIGGEKGVVAVFLPLVYIPIGNRYYYPIYEEAERLGLPIIVHPTSTDFIFQGAGINPAGWAETYAEFYTDLPVMAWTSLSSLLLSGTFDRFPSLKVAFIEFGFSWALPLLWRMEKAWQSCRFEVPWVKRSPIEYAHSHVRFSTQPVDEPRSPKDLYKLIEMLGADLLMFSSDYPHWDGDSPNKVLAGLTEDQKKSVMARNAAEFFPLMK